MNWMLIVAGLIAVATTMGHVILGGKQFLAPMLQLSFDAVAKRTLYAAWHYITVSIGLAAAVLLTLGVMQELGLLAAKVIAIQFALYAVVCIVLGATAGFRKGVFKMFQWVFFIPIAVLAWLGA